MFSLLGCPVVIGCLLLSGCSSLQQTAKYDLEKQIERQQQYQLAEEPAPAEKMTASEYENKGDGYLRLGDKNRALLYYLKALALEPENPKLLAKEAGLLLQREKYGEAEKLYRKLLAAHGADAAGNEGLGRALLGQNRVDEAEPFFRQAVDLDSGMWRSCNGLALIYGQRGDYRQALSWMKKALAQRPQDIALINNLAVTYYLMEDYSQAETILRAAAGHSTNSQLHNNLALVYIRLGRFNEALEAFKKGAPSEAIAYDNMGRYYLAQRLYKEAIAAFETAIARNPKFYPSANERLEQAKQGMQLALSGFSTGGP